VVPFAALGLWASHRYWRTTEIKVPTPEALAEKAAAEAEEQRKQAEFEDKWYFRYPVAALMIFGALYLLNERPNLWWMSVFLAIAAAFQARELSLVGIAIGGGYVLIKGIASLPTSVAIVLGALIIAAAVGRRGGT
jgi:hypothetical protein